MKPAPQDGPADAASNRSVAQRCGRIALTLFLACGTFAVGEKPSDHTFMIAEFDL